MSDQQKLKETLSALFDHEAGKEDQLELRRLARALDSNPDMVETYQRYALTRAVLKGEALRPSSAHFVDDLREALEKENMENAPAATAEAFAKKTHLNWLRPVGRVAIAASVAVAVIYAFQLPLPVPAAAPAVAAASTQTDQNNRVLDPQLVTVSSGNERSFQPAREAAGVLPTGCSLDALRTDSTRLLWEKELPAGYVLCKQNEQTGQCESVVSKIGCYLN